MDLEGADDGENVHLRNPKLSLIFNNNDNIPPQPPPRKHKKNFREKIESVAKNSLQAFQSKKPVEEPLFVKKKINYRCPICDSDEVDHNRDHHHQQPVEKERPNKRKKNLSIVSLPNYNELKLTVATFDDIDKPMSTSNHNSITSLPTESKKLSTTASAGKLDTYITRCRSFGSLLPQQLLDKLRARKAPADVESDDSFGGLEDWDVGLIEHYNPKDASLPRPRKLPKDDKAVLSNIESLIVQDEDVVERPKPPVRRSESLVKKLNREAVESSAKLTDTLRDSTKSVTPPPSPVPTKPVCEEKLTKLADLPTEENGKVEHSSLMKILEKFSVQEVSNGGIEDETFPYIDKSDENSTNISNNSIEDFIRAEKVFSSHELKTVTV